MLTEIDSCNTEEIKPYLVSKRSMRVTVVEAEERLWTFEYREIRNALRISVKLRLRICDRWLESEAPAAGGVGGKN